MNEDYQIVYGDEPDDMVWGTVGLGISRYNKEKAGDNAFKRFCFVLQTADKQPVGGVIAEVYWGWLYIDLLWITEELRGRGYGHQLLMHAEDEARKRGAKNAYLDTFSFQAPDFYKRHGYRVFGELPDFPPGQQRYFFTKEL